MHNSKDGVTSSLNWQKLLKFQFSASNSVKYLIVCKQVFILIMDNYTQMRLQTV